MYERSVGVDLCVRERCLFMHVCVLRAVPAGRIASLKCQRKMELTHSTLLFFSMFSGSNSCLESFGSFFLCTSRSCLLALATGKKEHYLQNSLYAFLSLWFAQHAQPTTSACRIEKLLFSTFRHHWLQQNLSLSYWK